MRLDLLPLDVFAIICSYVEPSDVLSLGLVNKDIHDLINIRSIWIDQLLAVIHVNGLYPPSFPLRKMSLLELKQSACGPSRMIDRFWAQNVRPAEHPSTLTSEDRIRDGYTHPPLTRQSSGSRYVLPSLTRYDMHSLEIPEGMGGFSLSDTNSPDTSPTYHKMCLIPGGRFLACIVGSEAFLWDLGPTAKSKDFSPTIYCRWPITGDDIFMPGCSTDGKEIRLVIGSPPVTGTQSNVLVGSLDVYRIWEEDGPEANPLVHVVKEECAPLFCPDLVTFFTIYGDMFVFMQTDMLDNGHHQTVYMWNFINNTYAAWKVHRAFSEVFIDNGFLCMIHLRLPSVAVAGWKIPTLKPFKKMQEEPPQCERLPSFYIYLDDEGKGIPEFGSFTNLLGRHLDWYNVHIPVHRFDGFLYNVETNYELWTYGVHNWPTQWIFQPMENSQFGQIEHEPYVPNNHLTHPPPRVQLQHAAEFLGNSDNESDNELTVDPYRPCMGYTVKNMVSGNVPWLVVELPASSGRMDKPTPDVDILGPRDMKRPNRVITIELEVPLPPSRAASTSTPDADAGVDGDPDSTLNSLTEQLAGLDIGTNNVTMPLADGLTGRTDFSFDPCSGRFCFIGAGRKQIGIVEYLKWG